MELIAFDGYTFSSGGYTGSFRDAHNLGNFALNAQTIDRRGVASAYTGATVGVSAIPITFLYGGSTLTPEQALQKLLGILDPTNDQMRTLTAALNDGTVVSRQAIVQNPNTGSESDIVNGIEIVFLSPDPYWRSLDPTTVTATVTAETAVALVNEGQARAYPTFKVGWTTQRSTQTASVGWKYRVRETITNSTTRDWVDEPVCVDLGDTAALVSGSKAQADGDDLRVRYQGREINRTLTCWNTKRSLVHFPFTLKAGASATIEFVYGNPSANAPATMSTRDGTRDTYIAFDLEGASGTPTNASDLTSITVSGASYETDRWKDGFVGILSGAGSVRWRRIASNTGSVLTLNRALNTAPDATSTVVIWKSGIFMDGGRVTARTANTVTDDQHTNKWGAASGSGLGQLAGATVTFHGGTASPSTMTVQSNTADTMTFTSSFSVNPTVGDSYTIQRYGVWNYMVDTTIQASTHRGLYRANKYFSKPTMIRYGDLTPGGWQPTTYLPNRDDYSALRPYNTGSGGGHNENYWPVLRARRRMEQDRRYNDEGNGDGLSLYTAFGLQGVYFDYKQKNVNQVGKFVVSILEPGGEDWADVVTDSTKRTNLTAVAAQYVGLDAFDNPTRLYMGVLPIDDALMGQTITNDGTATSISSTVTTDTAQSWTTNIWRNGRITYDSDSTASPKSATVVSNTATTITTAAWSVNPTIGDNFTVERDVDERDEVEARTSSRMIVYLDLAGFGDLSSSVYVVDSEASIYDLNAILRLGGGQDGAKTPPYDRVVTGGDDHRVHLASGEYLRIACDPLSTEPVSAVYNSSDVLQYRAPWAVRVYHHEADITGTDTAIVSRDFMPIPAQPDLLTNGAFAGGITGWSSVSSSGGSSAAYDNSVYDGSTPGSFKMVLPDGSDISYRSTAFATVVGQRYRYSFKNRTDTASVDPDNLNFTFSVKQASDDGIIEANFSTFGLSEVDRWFEFGGEFTATETSTYVEISAINSTGSAGNFWYDTISVGPANLVITETAVGKLSVVTEFTPGWWG